MNTKNNVLIIGKHEDCFNLIKEVCKFDLLLIDNYTFVKDYINDLKSLMNEDFKIFIQSESEIDLSNIEKDFKIISCKKVDKKIIYIIQSNQSTFDNLCESKECIDNTLNVFNVNKELVNMVNKHISNEEVSVLDLCKNEDLIQAVYLNKSIRATSKFVSLGNERPKFKTLCSLNGKAINKYIIE